MAGYIYSDSFLTGMRGINLRQTRQTGDPGSFPNVSFSSSALMVQIGISLLIFRLPADYNHRTMEILGIIVIIIAGLIVFYWEDITSRGLF